MWFRWFAWKPVVTIEDDIVWLVMIHRRWNGNLQKWDYRVPREDLV